MSHDPAEHLRAMHAAFASLASGADVEAYTAEFYDPECEYFPVEENEVIRGREELARWNRRWFEPWTEFDVRVDEIVEADGVLLSGVTIRGRASASGAEVSQQIFHVTEFRDGKIHRMREYLERAQAAAAADLPQTR